MNDRIPIWRGDFDAHTMAQSMAYFDNVLDALDPTAGGRDSLRAFLKAATARARAAQGPSELEAFWASLDKTEEALFLAFAMAGGNRRAFDLLSPDSQRFVRETMHALGYSPPSPDGVHRVRIASR